MTGCDLVRVAVHVGWAGAEEARAVMLEVAPRGFEERESAHGLELAAYLAAAEARRVVDAFPGAVTEAVAPGWENAWRRFHRPVRVGRVWVGPPWEVAEKDAVAVVIDPGRAFGTGAHPTTRLCLELLQELEPGAFVDLGCGSGVLSIAAAKLGFGPVFALDVDPAAVEVAGINAAANGVDVDVRVEDVVCMPPPPADVAVANIALDAAEALAPRVQAGRLVTSGYLARDPIRLHGWKELEHRVADGWGAHVFAREGE